VTVSARVVGIHFMTAGVTFFNVTTESGSSASYNILHNVTMGGREGVMLLIELTIGFENISEFPFGL
jgi:hypothetical protein